MLLMGDSGLRREEAAGARRECLQPYPADDGLEVWAMTVLGKRSRERTVPVSAETVRALRVHWLDRGDDFDAPSVTGPLIAPLVIPNTAAARCKHDVAIRMPYESNHLYRLVEWLRTRLLAELDALSPATHAQLAQITSQALRHTFGTWPPPMTNRSMSSSGCWAIAQYRPRRSTFRPRSGG